MKPLRILSLFDGISCGQVALERAGIPVEVYYASEVDKYAIQIAQKNYPDTIQLGDVTNWSNWDIPWGEIDLLIGGSPCQGFSFAGKQLNFDDPRSKLFFVYAEILSHIRQANPNVKFLLENVKMKKEYQDVISSYLGVEPVEINSALVSAQNRKRLYWTNIGKIQQPEDKGILLRDIVHENTIVDRDKSLCLLAGYDSKFQVKRYFEKHIHQALFEELAQYIVPFDKTLQILDKEVQKGKVGFFRKDSQANRVYYVHGKGVTLCGDAGGGAAKMGQYLIGNIVPKEKIKGAKMGPHYLQYDTNGRGHGSQDQRAYYVNDKHGCLDTGCCSKAKVLVDRDYLFGCITPDRVDKRQNDQRFNDGKKFYTLTAQDRHGILVEGYIRKLTPIECERLQTLPDNYTEGISNAQRYKCLGNGWTVDVITHILKNLESEE